MNYSERRKEQAQKTETAILNAALELMHRDGFDSVTVRDICQKAGITTGAFYHHFKSKEELFDKGFEPMDQHMAQALKDHPADDPVGRLRAILYNYALFMETCGKLAAQYYQRRLNDPSVESMNAPRFTKNILEDCFRRAQQQGFSVFREDPAWTAEFCYCHFRGVVIDWLLCNREYSLSGRMMDEFLLFEAMFTPE